jgi:anti-sigma factor RsiW
MNCEGVRDVLLDHVAGRLGAEDEAQLRAHLARCETCALAAREERELSELLVSNLPRHPAPWSLIRRLERTWLAAPERRGAPALRGRRLALAACAAAALAVVSGSAGLYAGGRRARQGEMGVRLAEEAVGDHLRVLRAQSPLEIASGGLHQVKPWFEGRLDFAPPVPAPEVPELQLEGGAVGWYLDRDAAVLAYRLRLHRVTLLVFRASGLPWPSGDAPSLRSSRGFQTALWRRGELGYALVSDVDASTFRDLASRFAAAVG